MMGETTADDMSPITDPDTQQMMIDALWEEIILPQGGIEFLVRLVAKKTEAMADAP